MTPFWTSRDGLVETYVGDALAVLRQMPANSVHCCVTSPPYYGLRSYMPDAVQFDPSLTNEKIAEITAELEALGVDLISE